MDETLWDKQNVTSRQRVCFTGRERICLQKLIIKHKLQSKDLSASCKRSGWALLTEEFNSIKNNSKRTEAQLKKCWDNIKTRKKQKLERQGRLLKRAKLHLLGDDKQVTVLDEALHSDPLMPVKEEHNSWELGGSDSETASKEFDIAEVSYGAASPPRESAFRVSPEPSPSPAQAGSRDSRAHEREEELHKLRLAEKVWILKTLRERHATAQLERERAQLEKERAQLDRDTAQLEKERAQLDRERAQSERDRIQLEREKGAFGQGQGELDRVKRSENHFDS